MAASALSYLPVDKLEVPRHKLRGEQHNDPDFADLLLSVQRYGILVPLLTRPQNDNPGFYWVVEGVQRLACARIHGIKEIPIHNLDLGDDSEALIISVVANLHRVQTPPYQYAKALRKVVRQRPDLSLAGLSRLVGKPEQWVKDRLSLTKLTLAVGELVDDGDIPLKAAYGLTQLKPEDQAEMVKQVDALPAEDFYKKCMTVSRQALVAPHAPKEDRFQKFVANPTLRRKKFIEEELELHRHFYLSKNAGLFQPEEDQDPLLAVWSRAIEWVLQVDSLSTAERRLKYEQQMAKQEQQN